MGIVMFGCFNSVICTGMLVIRKKLSTVESNMRLNVMVYCKSIKVMRFACDVNVSIEIL